MVTTNPAANWFLKVGNQVHGPLSAAVLQEAAATGLITPETPIREGADGQWLPAEKVQGLFPQSDLALSVAPENADSKAASGSPDVPAEMERLVVPPPHTNENRTTEQPDVATEEQRLRRRAVGEFWAGIALVASFFIFGIIAEVAGLAHNDPVAGPIVGFVTIAALVAFGRAAVHWCWSLRRPVKAIMRPASADTNPEDALAEAFSLDMHGDWDPAKALYSEVERRWPEHGHYAQSCIKQIEEKQSRGSRGEQEKQVNFACAGDEKDRGFFQSVSWVGKWVAALLLVAVLARACAYVANWREQQGKPQTQTGERRERSMAAGEQASNTIAPETNQQQNRFVESWPAAFDAEAFTRLPGFTSTQDQFFPFYLKETEDEARRLGGACCYNLYINRAIAVLRRDFPRVQARLAAAKAEYERRFGPATENILRFMESKVPDWEKTRTDMLVQIDAKMSTKEITSETLEPVVSEMENIGKGKVPSPFLETLLMYHPKYQRNPAAELSDGFKKEFVSDGTGKAQGVRLKIAYPASWKAEARSWGTREEAALKNHPELPRPHLIQSFKSYDGRGPEEVSIGVSDRPIPGLHDPPSHEEEKEAARVISELQTEAGDDALGADLGISDTKKVRSGQIRLSGTPANWVETESHCKSKCNILGKSLEIEGTVHQFQVMTYHTGRIVMICCQAVSMSRYDAVGTDQLLKLGLAPDRLQKVQSLPSSKDRFVRMGAVFQQIVKSLEFDPIHEAVRDEDAQAVRAAVQTNPHCLLEMEEGESGFTPLHTACERGFRDMAELLLGLGADVNVRARNGETPLITAVAERGKDNLGLALLFIARGADVKAANRDGWTALHFAAIENMPTLAQALIDRGAAVDAKTVKGETPLDIALKQNSQEVVHLLRTNGADADVRHETGKTPGVAVGPRVEAIDSGDAATQRDWDKAIADCTEAIRLNPNDAGAYHNRGWAYVMKGDAKKAQADFDEAKRLGYKR